MQYRCTPLASAGRYLSDVGPHPSYPRARSHRPVGRRRSVKSGELRGVGGLLCVNGLRRGLGRSCTFLPGEEGDSTRLRLAIPPFRGLGHPGFYGDLAVPGVRSLCLLPRTSVPLLVRPGPNRIGEGNATSRPNGAAALRNEIRSYSEVVAPRNSPTWLKGQPGWVPTCIQRT